MNTESQNNNDIREQDLEINLIDIFRLIFVNWYWFVLSVLICIGFAFFYLKSSSKVYSRKASVLIRDDSKGGNMSESSAFADISFFGGKRNVCLLYTSDAADDLLCVDLGGRRIIKKKKYIRYTGRALSTETKRRETYNSKN